MMTRSRAKAWIVGFAVVAGSTVGFMAASWLLGLGVAAAILVTVFIELGDLKLGEDGQDHMLKNPGRHRGLVRRPDSAEDGPSTCSDEPEAPEGIAVIKLVMCLCRHPRLTREQFQDYWLNEHGPFFQKHAADMRSKKYVQSHTLDTPLNDEFRKSRGMLPEFDGVAEVWFESEADMLEAMSSPEGQKLSAALLADEQTFLDHARCSSFLVREHVL